MDKCNWAGAMIATDTHKKKNLILKKKETSDFQEPLLTNDQKQKQYDVYTMQ